MRAQLWAQASAVEKSSQVESRGHLSSQHLWLNMPSSKKAIFSESSAIIQTEYSNLNEWKKSDREGVGGWLPNYTC